MSDALCTPMLTCLACRGTELEMYLDLGHQPLANSFHDGTQVQPRYPLAVNVCKTCWHTQLTHAVNPDLMFKHYLYTSGTMTTAHAYFEEFAQDIVTGLSRVLKRRLRVLDIASNDGSLLEKFKALGCEVQGVDPAENLRPLSEAKDIPTYVGYWNEDALNAIGGDWDVIIAMNVFAHVSDPFEFLSLCKRALWRGGRIYIQTSQANMLKNGEFDAIYHEHHSFFTALSFRTLADRVGLGIADIRHVSIHGTSYLVTLQSEPVFTFPSIFLEERNAGYYEMPIYRKFEAKAQRTKAKTIAAIDGFSNFYRVVGYGAAAKAVTFLNYAGLDRGDLYYIIDDNPLKIGLRTPGVDIPVLSSAMLANRTPTLFVILAWNLYDEIMGRIKARRNNPDDSFLTYFPQVKLIG